MSPGIFQWLDKIISPQLPQNDPKAQIVVQIQQWHKQYYKLHEVEMFRYVN